jgi:tetratricopeptide (TPR) repeat protein
MSRALIVGLFFAVLAASASAQDWSWPDRSQNLKVLPSDWTGERLRPVMTGFTRALGVRCSYCHAGEEGKPLSTYDFVSDANPNKDRARAMLRMLGMIGDELKKLEPSGDKRVNMWCHTCHRGRPRPMTLEEELGEALRRSGAAAALEHYKDLKSKFLTAGAYRFDDRALNALGYEALRAGDLPGATAIFLLNTEEYPASSNAWDSYAEAVMKSGDSRRALELYRKSLALDPKNGNARKRIEEIESKPGAEPAR